MTFVAKPLPKMPEIQREFQRVAEAFQGVHQLPLSRSVPERPRDGMLVYADGTDWNPGSGEGVYCYYNSTWNKL